MNAHHASLPVPHLAQPCCERPSVEPGLRSLLRSGSQQPSAPNTRGGLPFAWALAAAALLSGASHAQSLGAKLEPEQVVPPATSPASGSVSVQVNAATGMVTIQGSYSNLGSDLDLAALHGPAAIGSSGATVASLSATGGTSGTFQGTVALASSELSALLAGEYYIDLHTDVLPGGELRGQIVALATAASRTAGTNPQSYVADAPVLGATWTASVDLSASGHTLALIVGFDSAVDIVLSGGQHLLCFDQGGNGEVLNLAPQSGPLALFQANVPNDMRLAGSRVFTQAVHIGGITPFALGNAQDLVFGL